MTINKQPLGADEDENPPAINLPPVMTFFLLLLAGIHALRVWFLSPDADYELIVTMAFIPGRYSDPQLASFFPLAVYWSPFTYALLHGDWVHLLVNCVWMAAFGAAVAKRFGTARFIVFCAVMSLGGALAHYLMHAGEMIPVIGASAIVSGMMGSASRFAIGRSPGQGDPSFAPALSLARTFSNRQVLIFLGIWFGLNFIFGSGLLPIFGEGQSIAWEAHVGGFVVGLLLFSLFDPQQEPEQDFPNAE